MSVKLSLRGRAGGGAAGGGAFGAVLKQSDDATVGLFVYGEDTDPSWHLRGVERQVEEFATRSSIRYPGVAPGTNFCEVVFGADRADDRQQKFSPGAGVPDEPETVNGYALRHVQYANPLAQQAEYAWGDDVVFRAVTAGVAGNNQQVTVDVGTPPVAVRNAGNLILQAESSNGINLPPPRDGAASNGVEVAVVAATHVTAVKANLNLLSGSTPIVLVTFPAGALYNDASVEVRGTSIPARAATKNYALTSTGANIGLTFHATGTTGNGFQVVFSSGSGLSASYDSAAQMTVTLPSFGIRLDAVIAAINNARQSGNQLITAAIRSGAASQSVHSGILNAGTAILVGGAAAGATPVGSTWDASTRRITVVASSTTTAFTVITQIRAITAFRNAGGDAASYRGQDATVVPPQTRSASGGVDAVASNHGRTVWESDVGAAGLGRLEIYTNGTMNLTTATSLINGSGMYAETSRRASITGSTSRTLDVPQALSFSGGIAAVPRSPLDVRLRGAFFLHVQGVLANTDTIATVRAELLKGKIAFRSTRSGGTDAVIVTIDDGATWTGTRLILRRTLPTPTRTSWDAASKVLTIRAGTSASTITADTLAGYINADSDFPGSAAVISGFGDAPISISSDTTRTIRTASTSFEIVGTGTSFLLTTQGALTQTNLAGGSDARTRQPVVVLFEGRTSGMVTYGIFLYGDQTPVGHRTTLQQLHDAWEDIRFGANNRVGTVGGENPSATIHGTASREWTGFVPTTSGGANYVPASPIEFLHRDADEADGKNIEVRYHTTDTLQEILDASLVQDHNQDSVIVVDIFGTDLTANPEATGFRRRMYPEALLVEGGGGGGEGSGLGGFGFGEANVQADWDESDDTDDAYIKNKPTDTGGEANVQADWDESDDTDDAYIKNKPTIRAGQTDGGEANVQADWSEADDTDDAYIRHKPAVPAKASNADVDAETDDGDYTTVAKVFRAIARKVRAASKTAAGLVELASHTEIDGETDDTKVPTVLGVFRAIARKVPTRFDQLTGMVADNQVPPGITRDTEVQDSVTGLAAAGGVLVGSRRSAASPIEVTLPLGRGVGQIGFWTPPTDYSAGTADTNRATGIILPSSPGDDEMFVFAVALGHYQPVFRPIRGKAIKAMSVETAGSAGDQNDVLAIFPGADAGAAYGAKTAAGELLLSHDATAGWFAATNFFALYKLTSDPPAPGDVASSVIAALRLHLTDVASASLGTSYTSSFFVPDESAKQFDIGGVTIDSSNRIVIPADGIYLLESSTHFRDPSPVTGGGSRRTLYTRFRAQRGGSIIAGSQSIGTAYMRGSTDAAEAVVEHADWQVLQRGDLLVVDHKAESSARNYLVEGATSVVELIGFAIAATAPPAPSITNFVLTGALSPTAGGIDESYDYVFSVAQSSSLSALRIVHFSGTAAEPSSVTVLATIAEADWHGGSGRFRLQVAQLTAGSTETVRLEAYAAGQTPATDQPVSYQDVRITASAPTAVTRFVRVRRRVGTPSARPTAATLVANMTVMQSETSVIGDWAVSGIPNDDELYLMGWIVPQVGAAQPNHWTQAGIRIDNAVAAPFALTQNGVDYHVYLFEDANGVDDTYNGSTITVT